MFVDNVNSRLTNLTILLASLDVKSVLNVAAGHNTALLVVHAGTQRLSRLLGLLLVQQIFVSLLVLLFLDVTNEFSLHLR